MSDYDHLIKVLIIGNSGVGKSCLLERFADHSCTTSYISTIGVDFKVRTEEINGKKVKLQLWDTAGQERFASITHSYYRGAQAIMIVYDVTDIESFQKLGKWLYEVERYGEPRVTKMLIGNKCDLEHKRVIDKETGQAKADEFKMQFMETSAKDATNVRNAFINLAKEQLKKEMIVNSKPVIDTTRTRNVDINLTPIKSSCC